MDIHFVRMAEDGWQETDARFYTTSRVLKHPDFLRLGELAASFDASIENFNKRGSNWQIDHISQSRSPRVITVPRKGRRTSKRRNIWRTRRPSSTFRILTTKCASRGPSYHATYRIARSSTSIQLPPIPERIKFERPTVALESKRRPKIRKLNPQISVNVNAFENEPVPEVTPLYVSPDRQRPHHVNLLLLTDDKTGHQHYVLIKDLSRLVRGRTNHHDATHVYCLHCFSQPYLLENHIPDCKIHSPQRICYPPPGEKVEFKKHNQNTQSPIRPVL